MTIIIDETEHLDHKIALEADNIIVRRLDKYEVRAIKSRYCSVEEFEDEAKMLGKYIHDNLWDENTGCKRYAQET